jgi:hypothetical protein
MDMEDRDIHWSEQLEDLIAQEGEKCRGLAWIHQKAEQVTSRNNTCIQIPVIVLSTLAGTASVGSASLFVGTSSEFSNILIGFVSIAVGVLNTVGNYFSFARKAEAHRIAHLHYSKLFSWVSIELALPRGERMAPENMLKQLRESMDRLAETTPSVTQDILDRFNKEFKDYTDVAKPAETNGLSRIKVFRHNMMNTARSIIQISKQPSSRSSEASVDVQVPVVVHTNPLHQTTPKTRKITPSPPPEGLKARLDVGEAISV